MIFHSQSLEVSLLCFNIHKVYIHVCFLCTWKKEETVYFDIVMLQYISQG